MKAESIAIADRIATKVKITHLEPEQNIQDQCPDTYASQDSGDKLEVLKNHFDFDFLNDLMTNKHLTAF